MTKNIHIPQLKSAKTISELSEILRIRSIRYPTNYMDLLLLENENKKLSEILILFHKHWPDSNDFKTVPRIKAHIRFRDRHDGWRFSYSGDPNNPIVKLIGLKVE